MTITITPTVRAHSATLRVAGDLVHGHADDLLDAVSRLLTGRSALRTLRVDCSELTYCDSFGLAVFLQIHRNTSAAGIRLHLDARPDFLDRILEVAGVLSHLTARPGTARLPRRTAPLRASQQDVDSSVDEVGN